MTETTIPHRWSRTIASALLLALAVPALAQDRRPPRTAEERLERRLERSWWNRDRFHQELALSAEQRSQMDQILRDHFAADEARRDAQRAAESVLADAILAGETDLAEEIAAIAEVGATEARLDAELRVALFAVLTEAQRAVAADQWPRLIGRREPRRDRER